tara:strand:- start:7797 stop:9200 length:1404 start_codon:yes stop_codon:yes gene_type:complete
MYIGRPQRTGPYITLDDISSQFNGVDVSFNLTSGGSPFIPDNPYTVSISLNGVIQEPVTSYTLVNDVITFANPPSSNANFFALVIGLTSDRVITNATSLATGVDISAGDISGNNLSVSGNLTAAGIVSASSFVGDGSQLSGIDATSLIDQNGTVRAQANPAGLVVTGILTATQFDGVDVTALRDSAGGNIIVQANPGGVVINGIATATTFVGNVTGNLTGNVTGNTSGTAGGLTGTPNITVGSVTASSGSFSGDVNIGGVLTYEDVTNIDSVGLITARNGINVPAGGVDVTGTLDVSSTATFGADANDVQVYGTTKILRMGGSNGFKIQEEGTSAQITQQTGSLRFFYDSGNQYKWAIFNNAGSVDLYYANNKKFETTSNGVTITGGISATGGTNAIGIQSGGLNISTGIITALNFVGAGNTFSVNGSTVDISIAAGSDLVIVDGGDFNSSSSTAGASSEINGGEFT